MLFRRVLQHVRDQNWTAVGIDFVIVVVGVFVGIQVSNWNTAMADKRLGEDYQQRLANDLANDLESLRGLSSYYSAVLDAVLETEVLLGQPATDPETLLTTAYRATEITFSPPTRSTWDQIVSSGHLGLLPRRTTQYLAEYFAFDFSEDSYGQLARSDYRRIVRRLIPVRVQQAIRAGCSDVRDELGVITGFMPDCDLQLDAETIARVARDLQEDPAVRSTLNFQYSDVYSVVANTEGTVALVELALQSLGHPAGAEAMESNAP